MLRRLAILGSTGSIGTQALEVVAAHPQQFKISALAAYHNDVLLETQIERFQPDIAVLVDGQAADRLLRRYRGRTHILAGEEGLLAAATHASADIVLTSMVGFSGLKPTLAAIEAGKTIALANKETLVAAGELVTALAKQKNVAILPVDSEHCAVFQCLQGQGRETVKKLILTASGGPFRGYSAAALDRVTLAECLRHPNWSMGPKITIDSATLANKGLEVIEARWLFGVDYDQIEVVVHPQSIIHSMVEFIDGAVIAQLGVPDMRVPIQYVLNFPERLPSAAPGIDFANLAALTFMPPDIECFPALRLALNAGRAGGTMPCVFNAANEMAVQGFMAGKIRFLDIPAVISTTMRDHVKVERPGLGDIVAADRWARECAAQHLGAELEKE